MNKVAVVGVCRRAVGAGDLLSAPVALPHVCIASRVSQANEAMDEVASFGTGGKDGAVRKIPSRSFHVFHQSNTESSLSVRVVYDVVSLSTAEQLAMLSTCCRC